MSNNGFNKVSIPPFKLYWSKHISTKRTGSKKYLRFHLFFGHSMIKEWGGRKIYAKLRNEK